MLNRGGFVAYAFFRAVGHRLLHWRSWGYCRQQLQTLIAAIGAFQTIGYVQVRDVVRF